MNGLQVEEIDVLSITDLVETSINTTENQTETGELKESILLDLSNQLKEKFEKMVKLENKLINMKKKETKQILKIYGLVKSIDKITNESIEVPHELQAIIDICSDTIEDYIDQHFFKTLYKIN